MEEKLSGILLQAVNYLGNSRILKVYTEKKGLISVIAKGVNRKGWTLFTTPFCIAEWVVSPAKKELYPLRDASLIDPLIELKTDYSKLASAGKIAKDLLFVDLAADEGHSLYPLALAYFQKLKTFSYPELLPLSFRLKFLKSEGLLRLSQSCSFCDGKASLLYQGDSLCAPHGPLGSAQKFSEADWETLLLLGNAKKFSELEEARPSSDLKEKIAALYRERIEH